jgi:hypothetical protein
MPAKPKNRGKPPAGSNRTLPQALPPRDFNDETPKFCLAHLVDEYGLGQLTVSQQAAFAKTLRKLAQFKWKELLTGPKHAHGCELLPAGKFKAKIPARFEGEDRFMVFRYCGKLPMAGVRVLDVFHILWIEREFGELYDHGGS